MKFLSFSNPWPWVIFHPDPAVWKRIENRSWSPPIDMIGQRFAIHAAKSMDESAFSYFRELGILDYPSRFDMYPSSAVLGVATIDRVRTGDRDHVPKDIAPEQRKWFFGHYGWVLTDVIALSPIKMKGGQGLRTLPPDVDALVADQLAALRSATRQEASSVPIL